MAASTAFCTASARDTAPSLVKMLLMCRFTVPSVIHIRAPIWALLNARATSSRTSSSRRDSGMPDGSDDFDMADSLPNSTVQCALGYRRAVVTGPLQNRVTPAGDIVAVPARGLLMGNRGCLHGPDRRLGVARWRSKMWICCVLDWRGRRRDVMPPGRWTALFFLDEATALAAGHRPCGYCRRPDHLAFGEAWRAGHRMAARPSAGEMDITLHAERVDRRTRGKLTRPARVGDLPDGSMALHDGTPVLLAGGRGYPWSFTGYGRPLRLTPATSVRLLTPPAIVAALGSGYRPLVHPSGPAAGIRRLSPRPAGVHRRPGGDLGAPGGAELGEDVLDVGGHGLG
jgi:hypothetical protein